MSPKFRMLMARGRLETRQVMITKFGKLKWLLMAPSEKDNYATFWAFGYATALEETGVIKKEVVTT